VAEIARRLGVCGRTVQRLIEAGLLLTHRIGRAVIERFAAALCQDSFHDHPEDLWRRTVRAWNQAVETVPGWPQVVLAPPAGREAYVLPLEAFPCPSRPMRRSGSTGSPARPGSMSVRSSRCARPPWRNGALPSASWPRPWCSAAAM
jgi:hypothetical protein